VTALVVALIVSASAVGWAQPSPPVLRGRVVADDNDRPLRRALVTLPGADGPARPLLTDDEGRFLFQRPGSSASLTVAKAGFASAIVSTPLRSPTVKGELVVRLTRGGVISGRVLDSNGEPAIGTSVVARMSDAAASETATFSAEADDLGEYRISGLRPGRYEVSLALTGTRVLTKVDYDRMMAQAQTTGLPSLRDLLLHQAIGSARSADVRAGEETGSLDFEIEATRTFRTLAPVMRQTERVLTELHQPTISPHGLPEPGRPGGPPSILIGNPQPALNGGRILSVFAGSAPRSLDILLSGGGAVSGMIVDAAGEPFQGVSVRALQVRREHERSVARAFGWQRVTDDRGRYRLFGLAPGSYLIVASLDAAEFDERGALVTGFAPQYFPGTAHVAAAQSLLVEADVDLSGADFTFAASPVVRVTGRALDAIGQPLVGRVQLSVSQRSGAIATEPRVARTGPGGSFELVDVAPGDYVIHAAADAGFGGPPEFGFEYVTVTERDATPAVIPTSRGATLEGRFVVEGMQNPPMRAFSLHAAPTDLDRSPLNGRGPQGLAIHDDGRFYVTGLHGPMRLSVPNTLPGWYLKSITIGGLDVTDASYDFGRDETTVGDAQVVLSNSAATIAGWIERQSDSRPAAAVIAFSTSRNYWFTGSRHIRRASSDAKGSFDVTNLPPGEYFVVAVDASLPLDLQAPDTLESLVPRAARVTAREGAVSEVTLRLIRR
jgi:hypothetical protein